MPADIRDRLPIADIANLTIVVFDDAVRTFKAFASMWSWVLGDWLCAFPFHRLLSPSQNSCILLHGMLGAQPKRMNEHSEGPRR